MAQKPDIKPEIEIDPTPFSELCNFAEQEKMHVEIEKPFTEFPNLFLKLMKGDEVIEKITLEDISSLDKESAKILNKLSA